MKLFLIYIGVAVSLICTASAQPPQTLWFRTFGGIDNDYGFCVRQTMDGGFIITGRTRTPAGDWDAVLVKTDGNGFEQWTRAYGDSAGDCGFSVIQTSSGEYVFSGITRQDENQLCGLLYIMKTDSLGEPVWTRAIGDSFFYNCGNSVTEAAGGGYVVSGILGGAAHTAQGDVCLIKFDTGGAIQWNRTFDISGRDCGYCLRQTSEGGFIISGAVNENPMLPSGEVLLMKTSGAGDISWLRLLPGDIGYSVRQTFDGGYIVGGWTDNWGGDDDALLVRTDSSGGVEWVRTYGGNWFDECREVDLTTDGGFIIAGRTFLPSPASFDAASLIKTDSAGYVEWSGIYGSSGFNSAFSVQRISDGGYIFSGVIHPASRNADIWLVRLAGNPPPPISITVTPHNPPVQIPAGGGTVGYHAELSNSGANPATFDLWSMVTLPGGGLRGPISGPLRRTLGAIQTVSRDILQTVPERAPAGIYHYHAYVGEYPGLIWDEDSFEFEKLGAECGELVPQGIIAGRGVQLNAPTKRDSGCAGMTAGDWTLSGFFDDIPPGAETRRHGKATSPQCAGTLRHRNTLNPEPFTLEVNPNPFNAATTVSFQLQAVSQINLSVYDIDGREVQSLAAGWYKAGIYNISFDGYHLPSGVYFLRLVAGNYTQTKKLLLVK